MICKGHEKTFSWHNSKYHPGKDLEEVRLPQRPQSIA
jgi:hypothetical protein